MNHAITVEETCAKDFEIEASSVEEVCEIVEQKYKSGEFIIDLGEYQFR